MFNLNIRSFFGLMQGFMPVAAVKITHAQFSLEVLIGRLGGQNE